MVMVASCAAYRARGVTGWVPTVPMTGAPPQASAALLQARR